MSLAALSQGRASARAPRLALDPWLLSAVFALLLLGLIVVTSASMPFAARKLGDPFGLVSRQLLFAGLGCVAMLAAFAVRTELWERAGLFLMLVALGLLVLVLVPGVGASANGARRWLSFGFMRFQASELARLFVLIYLCSYAVRHREELRNSLRGVFKPLAVLVFAAALMLVEPDMGGATVLFATGFFVLFIAGLPWKYVLSSMALGGIAFYAAALGSVYRQKRWDTFLNPWADPEGSGFQLIQSLIAIGRGEWFGVGLGASVQKLAYLPEAHTDFVFAVMAEELGLLGVTCVLALYVIVLWRTTRIANLAAQAGQMFQAYLAGTFGVWLAMQAFINIGVNMGVLPTKGLTLPLMSYGGTSLLVSLLWLGIVLRIHHECAAAGRLAVPREIAPRPAATRLERAA